MNRTTKFAALLFGMMQLIVVESAHANGVTFNSLAVMPPTSSAFISDGFSFATSRTHAVWKNVDNFGNGLGVSNGSNLLTYFAEGNNYETFSKADSTSFTLSRIDIGGGYQFGSAIQSLTITGYRVDNTSVTTQLDISTGSFQTYSLNGFTHLRSVKLGSAAHGYVAVDNIMAVTTPVPEPETSAMMLAGLGLLGFVGRRRKRK